MPTPRSCDGWSPGATSSATRSRCATTCSGCGATRPAPGKPAGDDLRSGKPTALLTWAGELLPEHARPLLAACDAGSLDDAGVDALQQAMVDAGVRDRAEEAVADLVTRAHRALDDLDVDPEADAALRDLADAVAWRSA